MRTSDVGIQRITQHEGLRLTAYKDIAGVWTIGYGHTGPEVQEGMRITQEEALQYLAADLEVFEDAVDEAVNVTTTQNQFDALVSLAYNIGPEAFRTSTVVTRLNKEDYVGAAQAFTMWHKATINGRKQPVRGLLLRRLNEAHLFVS